VKVEKLGSGTDRVAGAEAACSDMPGRVVPVIDRNRCEGKSACVDVCPYHVFELRTLAADDRAALSLVGKLKSWVHGGKQSYAVGSEDCHACGLCVAACPERAIRLMPA
jgi:4Fe-4S ferredoxin